METLGVEAQTIDKPDERILYGREAESEGLHARKGGARHGTALEAG